MKLTWTEGKDGVLEARIGGEKCWVYPASGEHCATVVVPTNNADTGWHYRPLPTTDDAIAFAQQCGRRCQRAGVTNSRRSRAARWSLRVAHHRRSRHSSRLGRSARSVVSLPCPGYTTVASS